MKNFILNFFGNWAKGKFLPSTKKLWFQLFSAAMFTAVIVLLVQGKLSGMEIAAIMGAVGSVYVFGKKVDNGNQGPAAKK